MAFGFAFSLLKDCHAFLAQCITLHVIDHLFIVPIGLHNPYHRGVCFLFCLHTGATQAPPSSIIISFCVIIMHRLVSDLSNLCRFDHWSQEETDLPRDPHGDSVVPPDVTWRRTKRWGRVFYINHTTETSQSGPLLSRVSVPSVSQVRCLVTTHRTGQKQFTGAVTGALWSLHSEPVFVVTILEFITFSFYKWILLIRCFHVLDHYLVHLLIKGS